MLAYLSPCFSADQVVSGTLMSRLEYNDNITLNSGNNIIETFRHENSALMSFSRAEQDYDVTVRPVLRLNNYLTNQITDNEDWGVSLEANHRRSRFFTDLNFNYYRDEGQSVEDSDTGIFNDRQIETTISLIPTATYLLTDRDSIRMTMSAIDVSFAGSDVGSVGYNLIGTSALYSHSFSDRLQLRVDLSVDRFRPGSGDGRTITGRARFGANYRWRPDWIFDFDIGASVSDVVFNSPELIFIEQGGFTIGIPTGQNIVGEETDTDYLLAAGIEKRFESASAILRYTRSLNPSRRGAQSTAERIRFEYLRSLSERLDLGITASAAKSTAQGGVAESTDTKAKRVEARLTWQISRSWSLSGRYEYLEREFGLSGVKADFNKVSAILQYNGFRWQL